MTRLYFHFVPANQPFRNQVLSLRFPHVDTLYINEESCRYPYHSPRFAFSSSKPHLLRIKITFRAFVYTLALPDTVTGRKELGNEKTKTPDIRPTRVDLVFFFTTTSLSEYETSLVFLYSSFMFCGSIVCLWFMKHVGHIGCPPLVRLCCKNIKKEKHYVYEK